MKLQVIASSSAGNAYVLDNGRDQLLLECGTRYDDIRRAMDLSRVAGCLVTHEHGDHSKSVKQVMGAGIDCYMSRGTADALGLQGHRLHTVTRSTFRAGSYDVKPFDVQHDAAEPLGWLIQDRESNELLLFATDTYYLRYTVRAHYYMLECNYCDEVLSERVANGDVHPSMKKRLLESHFSLKNVCRFIQASKTPDMRKIILMHLSAGNADPDQMQREVAAVSGCEVCIAGPGERIDLSEVPY